MAGERKALKDYESALVESGYGEFEIFVTEPSALLTLVAGNHVPWLGAKFLIFPFKMNLKVYVRKPTTPNPTLFCFLDLCLGPTIQNPVISFPNPFTLPISILNTQFARRKLETEERILDYKINYINYVLCFQNYSNIFFFFL
jgi:hypothetical protein